MNYYFNYSYLKGDTVEHTRFNIYPQLASSNSTKVIHHFLSKCEPRQIHYILKHKVLILNYELLF